MMLLLSPSSNVSATECFGSGAVWWSALTSVESGMTLYFFER